MNDTVKLLLSLSLSGSIIAILIFIAKPFIKQRLSKSIQYYIWIVVLLRLILPFSFEVSIMNELFYGNQVTGITNSQGTVKIIDSTNKNAINSSILTNVEKNVTNGVYNGYTDHSRYLADIFNQYALRIWLLGVVIALTINLFGYIRFLKYLKQGNRTATDEENKMLIDLLGGRNSVRLIRNKFVPTPMLIGIIKPYIIIPDIDFNNKQLKNILLHEISHLKHLDIGIKWLTMIVTSIHWFNPLMYFIKNEINHGCELACDEAVIKKLNNTEKQDYGDTLISAVTEHKYPVGVLQATMCEDKKSLKERLIAIMNYNKKSKGIIIFSVILVAFVIISALYLGAGVGIGKNNPPNLYISADEVKTKVARIGTYSWSYHGTHIQADAMDPIDFEYRFDNIISVSGEEKLILGTQKLKADKKYDFNIEDISVYKDRKSIEFKSEEPSFMNGELYLQAPLDKGEYIYTVRLNFKDRGTVNYGFVVRVDMLTYDLNEISKYKTPYIGDNSKVGAIVGRLPVPDKYFKQRFTSMQTSEKPYSLTIYYEAAKNIKYEGEWPIGESDPVISTNSIKNTLVVFAMIDNLDEVIIAFRDSQSDGELIESRYNLTFRISRAALEEKYGDLSELGENLDLLQDALTGK